MGYSRECRKDELNDKLKMLAQNLIPKNETVKICIEAKTGNHTGAYILTENYAIRASTYSFSLLDMDKSPDETKVVRLTTNTTFGECDGRILLNNYMSKDGNWFDFPKKDKCYNKFRKLLQEIIYSMGEQPHPLERLEELNLMKHLLSEQEYLEKRREIIDGI